MTSEPSPTDRCDESPLSRSTCRDVGVALAAQADVTPSRHWLLKPSPPRHCTVSPKNFTSFALKRKSRSRETALSKTDLTIVRLLLLDER